MTTQTTRLAGREAIEYAMQPGLRLGKYADPTEVAREDLDVAEAVLVATEDPALIYLDVVEG